MPTSWNASVSVLLLSVPFSKSWQEGDALLCSQSISPDEALFKMSLVEDQKSEGGGGRNNL